MGSGLREVVSGSGINMSGRNEYFFFSALASLFVLCEFDIILAFVRLEFEFSISIY